MAEEVTPPEPILQGKFAIFETADGGYHLTYRPDTEDEDKHVNIPGFYVKMAMKQAGGKGGMAKVLKMFG